MSRLRLYQGLDPVKAQDWIDETIDPDKLTEIFSMEVEDDNIWDSNEQIRIYKGTEDNPGYGVYHEIPGGYSEFTYDPDTTERFYKGATWDWFYRYGLDEDLRSHVSYLVGDL